MYHHLTPTRLCITNTTNFPRRLYCTGRTILPDPKFSEATVSQNGSSIVVTLNRPKALNSLNLAMVKYLTPLYKKWDQEKGVSTIILRGEGQKAFCAGGDIVQIYHSGKQGGTAHKEFFREEYSLDYLIGTLKTPHVALLDGVTMGGGVGLSVHGKFRVATENTLFAMPETGIGFFPDVGGTFFLPRLPGALGTFLALTGHRLKGEEVVTAGVATHYVLSESLPKLLEELGKLKEKNLDTVNRVISRFASSVNSEKSIIVLEKELIDRVFSLPSVEKIFSALSKEKSEFAQKILQVLQKMSPTSLKVTLRLMREGKNLDLASCFLLEYKVSQAFMKNDDFYEGVRAQLVDKDRNPKWQPSTLEEVKDTDVDKYFTDDAVMLLEDHQQHDKANL